MPRKMSARADMYLLRKLAWSLRIERFTAFLAAPMHLSHSCRATTSSRGSLQAVTDLHAKRPRPAICRPECHFGLQTPAFTSTKVTRNPYSHHLSNPQGRWSVPNAKNYRKKLSWPHQPPSERVTSIMAHQCLVTRASPLLL